MRRENANNIIDVSYKAQLEPHYHYAVLKSYSLINLVPRAFSLACREKVYSKCIIRNSLKHVKARLKPNLHKIRKTVIALAAFGISFAELAA